MHAKHTSHPVSSKSSSIESDAYQTVDKLFQTEIKIQGSRFISILNRINSVTEFDEWLTAVRKKYFDATHHCFAYRLGMDGLLFRFNDDGEPNGTAGKRILRILEGHHLVYAGLIVIRYFGGTKLGVGGLSRAYSEVSEKVVSKANIITKYLYTEFYASFPSDVVSDIHRSVDQYNARIISQTYNDKFKYLIQIRQSRYRDLTEHLIDSTNGSAIISQRKTDPYNE